MAHDSLVFFVESVHSPPGERNACLQFARMGGKADVLPRPSRCDVLLVGPDAVPGGEPEIGVLGGMLGAFKDAWGNVGLREVGDRIEARLEEQKDILAILRSARACAGATARRTTVSWAAVRAQGTGPLLPLRADLVARTVPCSPPRV
jgi:hypothetical protein